MSCLKNQVLNAYEHYARNALALRNEAYSLQVDILSSKLTLEKQYEKGKMLKKKLRDLNQAIIWIKGLARLAPLTFLYYHYLRKLIKFT